MPTPYVLTYPPLGVCIRDEGYGEGDIAHLMYDFASDRPREQTVANAQFLVLAANCHHEMRDLLIDCHAELLERSENDPEDRPLNRLVKRIDQALTNATGEEQEGDE